MSEHEPIPGGPAQREREALEHVLRELRAGRSLDAALDDAYVGARLDRSARGRLLDHPEVAAAVGAGVTGELRRLLAERTPPSPRPPEPEPAPDAGIDDALRAQLRAIDPTP